VVALKFELFDCGGLDGVQLSSSRFRFSASWAAASAPGERPIQPNLAAHVFLLPHLRLLGFGLLLRLSLRLEVADGDHLLLRARPEVRWERLVEDDFCVRETACDPVGNRYWPAVSTAMSNLTASRGCIAIVLIRCSGTAFSRFDWNREPQLRSRTEEVVLGAGSALVRLVRRTDLPS